MMRKQISIAFLGTSNGDPISFIVARMMIEMAHKQGIPIVFSNDTYCGISYDDWIKSINQESALADQHNQHIEFKPFLKRDLPRPYVSSADKNKILDFLKRQTGIKGPAFILQGIYQALEGRVAATERIKLAEYLKAQNIPFTSIQSDMLAGLPMDMLAEIPTQLKELFGDVVVGRIQKVLTNITTGLSSLPGNGLIFVLSNAVYAHRLAAHFMLKYNGDDVLRQKYDISFFPCVLASPYSKFHLSDSSAIDRLKANDPAGIKQLYPQLPCPFVKCKDEKDLPAELTSMMDKAFLHLLPKKVTIVVPSYHEETKKPIIERFKGKVLNTDKNNYATVEITSVNLNEIKRDTRDLLGIQRIKIADLKKEQLDFLKHDKKITIETAAEPNTFFLTFPANRRPFIGNVIEEKEWTSIQARQKAFEEKLKTSVKAYKSMIKTQLRFKAKKSKSAGTVEHKSPAPG